MTRKVPGVFPPNARVLIVGEAPGDDEVKQGQPFVGASGKELTRMLHEAGFVRADVAITNVCKIQPPKNDIDKFFLNKTQAGKQGIAEFMGRYPLPPITEGVAELGSEIENVAPDLIIALGNTALWALTGEWGITSWRGSYLNTPSNIPVIPTYHPAAILRAWYWRPVAIHDLKRARAILDTGVPDPGYNFITAPTFEQVMQYLDRIEAMDSPLVAVDIETRNRHIACIGFGLSPTDAICIPLMSVTQPEGYWTFQEEVLIVQRIRRVLLHIRVIGQNFTYDLQYIIREWGVAPTIHFDTMVGHPVCFPGTPRGLHYISSLYCRYHRYWKDESKDWDPKLGEQQLWLYNCKDCVTTWECADVIDRNITHLNLREQFNFIMDMLKPLMRIMLRGVRIDKKLQGELVLLLLDEMSGHEAYLEKMVAPAASVKKGASPWYRSPIQQRRIFFEEMGIKPTFSRKTRKPSCDDEALPIISKREPLLLPVLERLAEYRSLQVISGTFVQVKLDHDNRMRSVYDPTGTETFRFASREDAFGFGTNSQNIPRPGPGAKSKVRNMLVPDPGYIIGDVDLDRADLQIVVWEADDTDLKRQLRLGVDVHIINGCGLGNKPIPPEDELIDTHPEYPEHCNRFAYWRQFAKNFCHGTNYGGSGRTMASVCGITTQHADFLQRRWFQMHPGIKRWHTRVEDQLAKDRTARNAFGFRIIFYDRIGTTFTNALAWIPQSTVAIIINKGILNVDRHLPQVQGLLQVHDSFVMQWPKAIDATIRPQIRDHMLIPVPYDDPLTIPVGLKVSDRSWGECKGAKWKV